MTHMPGLTADASLSKVTENYEGVAVAARANGQVVTPQVPLLGFTKFTGCTKTNRLCKKGTDDYGLTQFGLRFNCYVQGKFVGWSCR